MAISRTESVTVSLEPDSVELKLFNKSLNTP